MDNSLVLSIGDSYHLKTGKDKITYAGMPSEDVFSIVQRKQVLLPVGLYGQARNLFFPKNQSTIRIDEINIIVDTQILLISNKKVGSMSMALIPPCKMIGRGPNHLAREITKLQKVKPR